MRPLERCFHQYGRLLARHPWPFIILPAIITCISGYGYLFFHSEDDIWDIYAPTNGISRVEEAALKRFEYASASHHYRMQILVTRKDNGNLLENVTLAEVAETHKFISENITGNNGERDFAYREMCGIYCNDSNAAVIAFLQTVVESSSATSTVRLTYPNAQALQKKIFLGYSLGDLTFDEKNVDVVKEARLFILHYMVNTSLPHGKELSTDYERKVLDAFARFTIESSIMRYQVLSRNLELQEQRAITETSIPFLGLTVIVLTCFMVVTMFDYPFYRSQHWESLIGVFSPGMALFTSGGILFWLGYPFSNILTVVPFLVVTIGIDDAFLILAGWRQSTKGATLEERMGEAVAISGASVTVTSVTDVLCFGIGLFSNMPVVQLFCLHTSVALFIDYVYQVTFFTALMGLVVKRQVRIESKTKNTDAEETSSIERWKAKLKQKSSLLSLPWKSTTSDVSSLEVFVDWLHSYTAKFTVLALFAAHVGICSYYAMEVNTDFDMENLYLHDSPLTEISRRMQDFVLREAFVDNFAVYPMPKFGNETIRDEFEEMVAKLETIPTYSAGPESTTLWTRDFASAISFWGGDEDFWTEPELLRNYREYGMEEKYITTMINEDGDEVIDGFFFAVVYKNMTSFLETEKLMEIRRSIIASYPQFTVHAHHPFEKVPTESAAAAPINFYQTTATAVILMSILVLLFVMNFEAIISVVISILSICLGIVSYLHLWEVHLDAVSLISILMSIGFSVDYSAHVCYHYFAHALEEDTQRASTPRSENSSSTESTPSQSSTSTMIDTRQRMLSTLRGVGWPVMQSGLSTMVGMFPLMFIHAYVVAVFWKTIILVAILGMFHALLLLPIVFIITNDVKNLFKRCFCR